jgi:GntR family transcriptional regulator
MFQLNYRDTKPIYEQIKDGLQRLVISQAITPDEKLPSVKDLASSLTINPNTIQRAYRELENEGYVYTIAGKGTFVAPLSTVSDRRMDEILHEFDDIVTELLYMSIDPDTLNKRIIRLKEGGEMK